MSKLTFKQESNDIKICPNCRENILKKWTHAYENEWCPNCGCNYEEIFEEKFDFTPKGL